MKDWLDAAVLCLGQGERERWGHGGKARGGWLGGDVLLGLGGGRGRGGETEQRAEASRGGQRRPKLMGGHCGNHVVKYTCKSHSRNGGRRGGREGGYKCEESEKEGDKERSKDWARLCIAPSKSSTSTQKANRVIPLRLEPNQFSQYRIALKQLLLQQS